MSLIDYAVPVSAAGTMLSAAIACITYVTATMQRNRIGLQLAATKIRDNIQATVNSTQIVVQELNEGTVLLAAASTTVDALRSRLSANPNNNELREVMGNSPLMLSVAISGWHNNTPAREFYQTVHATRHLSDSLTGPLRIYIEVLDMLVDLIRDGYSSIIFKNILEAIGQGKIDSMNWDVTHDRILDEVTVRLQSDSAMHFVARYAKSTKEMRKFVEYLSKCLLSMRDNDLVYISSFQRAKVVDAATRTESMRSHLRAMSPYVDSNDLENLSTLVSNIETYISKSHARDELKNFERPKR